jgi:hypothetical protein
MAMTIGLATIARSLKPSPGPDSAKNRAKNIMTLDPTARSRPRRTRIIASIVGLGRFVGVSTEP